MYKVWLACGIVSLSMVALAGADTGSDTQELRTFIKERLNDIDLYPVVTQTTPAKRIVGPLVLQETQATLDRLDMMYQTVFGDNVIEDPYRWKKAVAALCSHMAYLNFQYNIKCQKDQSRH